MDGRGSKADGAVDDDRGDDDEESDLQEHRGTTAASAATQGRHGAFRARFRELAACVRTSAILL